MSGIDEATGLPELPEGQHWRVVNEPGWADDVRDAWRILIIKDLDGPEWSAWEPCREFTPYRGTHQIRQVEDGRTWYGKRKYRKEVRYRRATERVVWAGSIDHPGDYPTKQDICHAAFKALGERDKKYAADRLVGDYPPKRLEFDND